MTVYEYLARKREENPDFTTLSDRSLYTKLQKENDPNLPKMSLNVSGTQSSQPTSRGQKYYERKVNPDMVNSLFDWTDWGINDESSEWAKSAYNNSITGLAYQMYNGEQRFNLDGYNPGMIADIGSAVLSFSMPLDFASMFVGGIAGKGLTSLGGFGMKAAATENLVRLGAKKGIQETAEQLAARKIAAKATVAEIIGAKGGGYSALLSQYAPKSAGAIAQSATLATFEGVRGGMSAAVNDEDIWAGIGHGVMHGGIMGGISGAVGASLNVKNAALWNKKKKSALTPAEEKSIGFWRTGKGGQVAAEAGVFTAPEIKNLIMDEDYSMRDLTKSFFTNAGMMGILKIQHKGQNYLWGEGRKAVKEYWKGEGNHKKIESEMLNDAIKSVEENTGMDIEGSTVAQDKSMKETKKALSKMENESLKLANSNKKESKEWEKKFNDAERDLARMDVNNKDGIEVDILRQKSDGSYEVVGKETIYHDPTFQISTEGIVNTADVINTAYGAMLKRIETFKKNNPQMTDAGEGKLKEYKEQAEAWFQLKNKSQNINAVKAENKKMSDKDRNKAKSKAELSFNEAWDTASEAQRKTLRKGLEDKISETGEVKDVSDFQTIQDRADNLLEIKKQQKPGVIFQAPQEKTALNKFKTDKTNIDVFETKVQDKIFEVEKSTVKTKYEKQLSKETLEFESTIEKSKLDDKIHKKTKGEDFVIENVTKAQEISYNESKDILKYISRELSRQKTPIEDAKSYLQIADKFSRFLARNKKAPKSLLEVKAKDIEDFVNENPASYKSGLSNVIKTLTQLNANYPGIITGGMTYTTGGDIGTLYRTRAKGSKMLGLTSTKADLSPTKIDVKNNTLTTGTKTDVKIKPITTELAEKLEALDMKSKENDRPGHKDFLYTDTSGEALINTDANTITKKFLGSRVQPSGGEARATRYSLIQWALKRFGKGTSEYYLIDEFSIGHKSNKKMDATYSEAIEAKGGPRKYTTKIIEQYITDIERGKYNDASGKEVSMKTLNKDIRQTGYYPHEIKKGLEKIEQASDIIKYKVGNETKYVDKATVETMIRHMIETGPRIREIVPTQKALDAAIEFSAEGKKTDYQLLSEAKTAESLVKASELVDQVKWVKKKFPGLHVAIKKSLGKHRGEYVLGKIQGHLIKIAKNKARIDTLPHEVSHHVVDVLKAMGDPFSKKIVKDGIRMFETQISKKKAISDYAKLNKKKVSELTKKEKKKAIEEAAEEAFVEALGKYTAKELPKGMIGRMKSWIARTFNHFKQYFGLTNKRDVAKMQKELVSIVGGKVLGGKIPTDIMPLKSRLKIKYQTSDTEVGKKLVKKAKGNVLDVEKQLMEDYKYTKEELRELGENIIGDRQWDKLDVSSIEKYQERLNILIGNSVQGVSKKQSLNEAKVLDIETRYQVTAEQRNEFFNDALNVSFEKANDLQLKSYNSYVIKGNEIKPRTDNVVDAVAGFDGQNMPSIGMFGRAFLTSADVIYKYGGAPGRMISRKLLNHDYTRSILKGEGEVVTERIKTIIGKDKDTLYNKMHMLDGDLAKGALKDIQKLHKDFETKRKNNKLMNPNEINPWKAELKSTADAIVNFGKGGKYYEARELWKGLSDGYWKTLIKEISINTKGNKEFQQIKETLDKKFIKQYFARRVTRKALEHLSKESPQIEKLIQDNMARLTKEDLQRAASSLNITKNNNPLEYAELMRGKGKQLENLIAEEILTMIEYGGHKVKPAFLKERGAQLPEFMEVNVNGGKELIRTYETSLDGTMGSYVNGMAKYIATVKHFPEFTELKGRFSLKSDAKLNTLNLMSKNNTMGAYAAETIKAQLGLDFSNRDILMNPALETIGKLTNISAVMGLSSPMAGIKNVLIQIPRSVAIYGTRNTMRALSYGVKTMRDPKLFEKAMRRGEIGYGTKELLRKQDPKIRWWFDNVNLMTQTENLNRIVLAEAGRMHFADLTNVARGTKSMFHPQGKKSEVLRMFKETWKLTDGDIKFITEGKNISGSARYEKILQRVGFESHKAGAGATGVSDLPLFFSNKYIKPLTLFQRMATSVTIDSYKNYVKPMKNGNFAPILKAAIGHGLTGAALFTMYDKFMGQQPPEEENPAIDRAISYLWKGEFFGMFGEIISPYDKGLSNPIMEPVLLRNAKAIWSEMSQVLGYGKGFDQAVKDLSLQSIVIMGQADRIFNNINHPYVTNTKRVNTLRRKFNEKMGYGTVNAGNFVSSRQPYYYKLKEAILFGKSDKEISRAYYAAYNFIVNEYENKNIKSKSMREKKAKESIEAVIRYMHPINLPDDKKGRYDSKRNEFLNYLSPANKSMALKLEREWKYKERAYNRIIRNRKWKNYWSVYVD